MSDQANSRRFDVYVIRDYMQDKQQKSQWTRVGVAFENSDGSWNLRLHALPLTDPKTGLAHLHMRPPRPREDAKGEEAGDVTMENFEPRSDVPF